MPSAPKRSSAKKPVDPKKPEPKKPSPPAPETPANDEPLPEDAGSGLTASEQEAITRRKVAQDFIDEGYTIVNAGEDPDGRHWIEGATSEEGDVVRRYANEGES